MKTSRFAVALALCAGAAAPVSMASLACAGEGGTAALVIDTGSAVTTYCVALPDSSVSGLELVELAGEQHGLDYSLGFGGEAVCRLEGVGPEGDDCFGEYPEFWGYWHGNGSGGWDWAGTGAGSADVGDGDVEGWSWGTGDNGSNHQAPPETEHADVCPPAEAPAVERPKDRSRQTGSRDVVPSPPPAPVGNVVTPASEAAPGRPPIERKHGIGLPADHEELGPVTAQPLPATPEPTSLAAEPAGDESDGGPPLTGLVGLAAAGALAVAAWRGSRRRTKG